MNNLMTLTVLIENNAPEGSKLFAEHGLSFFVETGRTKFIFDCGHTGAAVDNAKILGVNLSEIKIVALSHSHYDHAAGFKKFLSVAPIEKVFTGENFWEEKFSDEKYRGCGFDEKFLAKKNIAQIVCRDVTPLDENSWLVGNFKRRYDFETIPKKFLRARFKSGGTAGMLSTSKNFSGSHTLERHFVPDDFSDEIVLVLRGQDGLMIVVACAHRGILNIVASVSEKFSAPIVSVIGGLHLAGATDERISLTLGGLKNFGVKKILPCHCSGENFVNRCDEKILAGSVIKIK